MMKRRGYSILAIVGVWLAMALPAWAAITATANKCKAENTSGSTFASLGCTMPGNTTAGNFIAACVTANTTTEAQITGISDGTTSFTLRSGTWSTNDAQGIKLGDAQNITAKTTPTITVSFSPNLAFIGIIAQEFSGVATSGAFDQSTVAAPDGVGTGANALTTGASGTRTQADEVIVGCGVLTATGAAGYTAGTGYTEVDELTNVDLEMEYSVKSATGTEAATWTLSSGGENVAVLLGTFKAATADQTFGFYQRRPQ